LYSSAKADEWVTVGGLIPYSQYQVQVNATNLVGYIISNVVSTINNLHVDDVCL